MNPNERLKCFIKLKLLILTFTCLPIATVCDKTHCRYNQENAHVGLNSDIDNSFEPSQYFIYSHKTTKSSSSKNICLGYISSTSINRSDMEKMKDCTSIDMSKNQIESIEECLFEGLKELESLNLNHNELKSLPEGVFNDLVDLMRISIESNSLEVLSEDLFKFNMKLVHIGLSNNKLRIIPPTMLDNLNNLRSVTFYENACIESSFPSEVTLDELKSQIMTRCSDRSNIFMLITKFREIFVQIANGIVSLNETLKVNGTSKINETYDESLNRSSTKQTEITTGTPIDVLKESEMEILIVSLFWLIVPIILILCGILAAIFYAIYNKYFIYSL